MKMYKYIVALLIGCASSTLAQDSITNVYNLKMNAKVPIFDKASVRNYQSCTFKGYLYLVYNSTNGTLESITAEYTNSKTKITHFTEFDVESFYNLIGKTTKQSFRSVPTVFFTGSDTSIAPDGHEQFNLITLTGKGKLKSTKVVFVSGCDPCGESIETIEHCNILDFASGSLTGIADCLCPDDSDWCHTVKTIICGAPAIDLSDFDSVEENRSPDASIFGTWSMKYNKKLSK